MVVSPSVLGSRLPAEWSPRSAHTLQTEVDRRSRTGRDRTSTSYPLVVSATDVAAARIPTFCNHVVLSCRTTAAIATVITGYIAATTATSVSRPSPAATKNKTLRRQPQTPDAQPTGSLAPMIDDYRSVSWLWYGTGTRQQPQRSGRPVALVAMATWRQPYLPYPTQRTAVQNLRRPERRTPATSPR